jgi:hypothetical protein
MLTGGVMLRRVGAVLVGALVIVCVVGLLQYLNSVLYPLPAGVSPMDPADAEAFADYLNRMPLRSWVIAFGSEVLGAYLGALAAAFVVRDGRMWVPGIVIASAAIASVSNWRLFPHPMWFMVSQPFLYALVFFLVARVVRESTHVRSARAAGMARLP